MLYNTAIEILLRSNRAPKSLSAVLVDEKGSFAGEIGTLVERVSKLSVVTKKHSLYKKAAERIMEEYGASVVIRDKLLSVKDVDIVISPCFNAPEHLQNVIIINNTAKRISPSLKPKDFDMPYPYDRYLPKGTDKMDFAGALFEFCGAPELSKLCFRTLMLNSYEISLLSAAKTLDTNDGI